MVQEVYPVRSASQGQRSKAVGQDEAKESKWAASTCPIIAANRSFFCAISGRVHSAMVSKLNPAQRSVTVEWYERGETKGKEVELDMLLALNPELISNKQTYVSPPAVTQPVNLQRVSPIARPSPSFKFLFGAHRYTPDDESAFADESMLRLFGKFDTIKAFLPFGEPELFAALP